MAHARIALATAPELPELDEDAPALLAALDRLGLRGEAAIWDDPSIHWDGYDLVVVRSVWDAARRHAQFLAWADAVAKRAPLVNPPEVLRWNTDKRYLAELERGGAPIVPTRILEPGDPLDLPVGGDWVVKPVVSSGSMDTARYQDDAAGLEAHAQRLVEAGRTVMLQPYMDRIDEGGETALVYFDGVFSHAIEKSPILTGEVEFEHGLYAVERIEPRTATDEEHSVAERVLAAMPFDARGLTYARVDLVPSATGPVLLELELAEPSLFLGHAPRAAERFSEAIAAALGRSGPTGT